MKKLRCIPSLHERRCQVLPLPQHLNKDAFKATLSLHVFRRAAAPTETLVLPPLTQTVMCERESALTAGQEAARLFQGRVFISPQALLRA